MPATYSWTCVLAIYHSIITQWESNCRYFFLWFLKVSAISLPLTVIVNNIQKPQAWATILWDNAFADINRPSFTVVDQVPWQQLVSALDLKFHSRTGRCLTGDNIHYLCMRSICIKSIWSEFQIEKNDYFFQLRRFSVSKCIRTRLISIAPSLGRSSPKRRYRSASLPSGSGFMPAQNWFAINWSSHGARDSSSGS